MPLISPHEEKLLDPLSDEVASELNGIDKRIDRYKLKEFAFNRAKKNYLARNKEWKGSEKAFSSFLDFEVCLEFTHDLKNLVQEFLAFYKIQSVNDAESYENREQRIQKLQEKYKHVFDDNLEDTRPDEEIDLPIMNGLTQLHIAAQDGDMKEVVRLVEVEAAKVNVKDNSGRTPSDRAKMLGFCEISKYLDKFM